MRKLPLDESHDLGRLYLSAIQPEMMPKHERKLQFFRYEEPTLGEGKIKALARLGTTDITMAVVQKVGEGGETAMHLHAAMDGFWMVLKGRASFVGEDGIEHEMGPLEGIMAPRGTPYAFRKVGNDPLLLLQVECLHSGAKHNAFKVLGQAGEKSDMTDLNARAGRVDLYDARTETTS